MTHTHAHTCFGPYHETEIFYRANDRLRVRVREAYKITMSHIFIVVQRWMDLAGAVDVAAAAAANRKNTTESQTRKQFQGVINHKRKFAQATNLAKGFVCNPFFVCFLHASRSTMCCSMCERAYVSRIHETSTTEWKQRECVANVNDIVYAFAVLEMSVQRQAIKQLWRVAKLELFAS